MMEAALIKRLREATSIGQIAGVYAGKPAVDFDERKSNDPAAFPSAVQSLLANTRTYDQDGVSELHRALFRWDCRALSPDGAYHLAKAITLELEAASIVDGVRFDRGFLSLEKSLGPEEVGDLRIYRRIVDIEITAKTEGS